MSEQVNGDGALNGCDREKAARGFSTEGGSDPETVSKCSLPGSFRKKEKKLSLEALMQVYLNTHFFSLLLSAEMHPSATLCVSTAEKNNVFVTPFLFNKKFVFECR